MVARVIKEMVIVWTGIFALIYLIFPTFSLFELIPDAIPLIGSIDEAGATTILLNTLNYYGLDFLNLYGRRTEKKKVVRRVVPDPETE